MHPPRAALRTRRTQAANPLMLARTIHHSASLYTALLAGLCLPLLVMAAPPPATVAPTEPKAETAPPAAAAKAEPPAPAAASTAAAAPSTDTQDNAAPADPEPLLLARLAAKTLPADFIKLGADAQPILARYIAAAKNPAKGAVLVLPAPGRFIGDDAVIAALLAELPSGGWSVLAVQTPLLPANATLKQYQALHDQALARAKQGLEYLLKQETPAATTVVIVGRAGSIELAREAAQGAAEVAAIAALGPWDGPLGDSKLPLLDLSPDRDSAVLTRAGLRKQEALRAKLEVYQQTVLVGADQRYIGFEIEIARRIRGFAEHLPPPAKDGPPATRGS